MAPSSPKSSPTRPSIQPIAYHQDFLVQHPNHPYIVVNDLPKIGELKRLFPDLYRPDPLVQTN
jgi:peptide-methionine (S)-S-oxide reductase